MLMRILRSNASYTHHLVMSSETVFVVRIADTLTARLPQAAHDTRVPVARPVLCNMASCRGDVRLDRWSQDGNCLVTTRLACWSHELSGWLDGAPVGSQPAVPGGGR